MTCLAISDQTNHEICRFGELIFLGMVRLLLKVKRTLFPG